MRVLGAIAVVALAAAGGTAVAAPTGVITGIEGTASVTREGASNPAPLTMRHTLRPGDRIAVAKDSLVRLWLGTGVRVSVHAGSAITLPADDLNGVTLEWGTLVYHAPVGTLAPSEVHEVRAANAVARLHSALVVVELQTLSGSAAARMHLCVLDGSAGVRPRWDRGVELTLFPGECQVITGAQSRPEYGGLAEINRVRSLAGLSLLPPPSPAKPSPPRRRLPEPGPWVLLVDRGAGFEDWVGSPADGYVAADVAYGGMTLNSCDQMAWALLGEGERLACARDPSAAMRRTSRTAAYRDASGRVLARGPLAGRLIVYETGATNDSWRLVRLLGSARLNPDLPGELWIARCYGSMRYSVGMACVREGGSGEYRDASGRLMAEGPFAGGLIAAESR